MKKETQRIFCVALSLLASFVLWTLLICLVDVGTVGPQGSKVGFSTLNSFFHNLTGTHMNLYIITDWLGLIPICFVLGFALFGLIQWIKRKHLKNVDYSILVLGGFYIVVTAIYFLFEIFVVNYRPVLINGTLEASYPSSTTMMVLCVMPTSLIQFNSRIKNRILKRCISLIITAFIVFMVTFRFISGVHWFTDIIGGVLLSSGLVLLYHSVNSLY